MKRVIGILTLVLGLTFAASAQKGKTAEVSFASSVKCGMCKKTIEKAAKERLHDLLCTELQCGLAEMED